MASLDEQARWVSESAAVYLSSDFLVHATGDDASTWLNGQVTNDVRALKADAAVYALATTVKGRVISDVWARASERGPVLAIPVLTGEALLANLEKHIIMEDVELEPLKDLRIVSVQGPRAREVVASLPAGHESYACARLQAQGLDVVVKADQVQPVLASLAEAARSLGGGLMSDEGLAHAHILHAIPRVGIDFGDSSYPQEAGLKDAAVSFNKGCYTGQEVVYMLENRGQLSRRLVQLMGPADGALAKGTALFDAQGAKVGEVTSATVTQTGAGATLALAYLKRAVAEIGASVHMGSAEGASYAVRFVVGVTNHPCPIIAH